MSRGLSSSNQAQIAASFLHSVILVHMAFDTPAYAHSGVGNIEFDGNTYLGVGTFGMLDEVIESEEINAKAFQMGLSGVDSDQLTVALDSGKYGDVITFYEGYLSDDGTLVDDPWLLARGIFENAEAVLDDENVVIINVKHDIAMLEEKDGSRFSDEDQQNRFSGDLGLEFVTDATSVKLTWGGGSVSGFSKDPKGPGDPGRDR